MLFCTPDHTLDRLFSVNLRGRVWIQNSLVFLLARAGLRLSPSYPYYLLDFRSVFRGLRRCATELPTSSGARIRLHYLCNVMVTPDLTLTERPKPAARDFRDYQEYEGFLVDTLGKIGRNAVAPERVQTYRWLSSMSAGYDSAAAAALAQKAGGTTVIALEEARTLTGVSAGPDDSGAPIARHLGLPVVEFPTVAYRQAPLGMMFAEFAAAGDAGDVQFSAMEGHLAGTLFTGGFQGDHMWTRIPSGVTTMSCAATRPAAASGSSASGSASSSSPPRSSRRATWRRCGVSAMHRRWRPGP